MNLYVFSCKTVTNIWAGIGARQWAVSRDQADNIPGLAGKAQTMPIGASGIIYCMPRQSFTTPFLVYSKPQDGEDVTDVWPETWTLPFRIHPLGTPCRMLHKDKLKSTLPTVMQSSKRWDHVLHIAGGTVFSPSIVKERDWEIILEQLGDGVE